MLTFAFIMVLNVRLRAKEKKGLRLLELPAEYVEISC